MSKHNDNPNEPHSREIRMLPTESHPTGKLVAETDKWNAPNSISTEFGIATRVPGGSQYAVTLPVVLLTGSGNSYHAPGCSHAASSKPVYLGTAQGLGKTPCSYCRPDMVRVVVAELREPRKPNYSALYAAIAS